MSQETLEWLNRNILVGYTDSRGNAWHFRQGLQGSESNHYPGPIPLADVRRRLFAWEPISLPVFVRRPDGTMAEVKDRQAIATSDDASVLGLFSKSYAAHDPNRWLLDNVETILGGELAIGGAGLLRGRGQAYVSVEVPDNIVTPEGVEFRPHLLAYTSFDGTLATGYKRVVTNIVCDNTMRAGLAEAGQEFRVKHTRWSSLRLEDARSALALIDVTASEFQAEVARLCQIEITPKAWQWILDQAIPVPTEEGRAQTIAERKRQEIQGLWTRDPRVAPWAGTGFGVTQAFNTHRQHYGTVRGVGHRFERTMMDTLTGQLDKDDLTVADLIGEAVAAVA